MFLLHLPVSDGIFRRFAYVEAVPIFGDKHGKPMYVFMYVSPFSVENPLFSCGICHVFREKKDFLRPRRISLFVGT